MLLIVLYALLPAQNAAEPMLSEPDIFGDRVVFTCEGDLWLGDISNGRAVRLTRDEGTEMDARFSPDGKRIAFSAEYDGTREVYVMPTEGGAPLRLTYTGVVGEALAWSADGINVLYRTIGAPNNVVLRSVPSTGGPSRELPIEFAATCDVSSDGELAFTRFARYNEPWYGYRGGMKNDVWVAQPGLKSFSQITHSKGTAESPAWVGDRIAYVEDIDGGFSVASVRKDGREPKRLVGPFDFEIRELASDGKSLVYEKGSTLEVVGTDGKVRPIHFTLASDRMHARTMRVPASDFVFSFTPSANGKRALVESRGQILSLPTEDKGEAKVVLAKDGARYRLPEPSPDAKRLAYVSDETGEQQVYVSDPDGANPRQVTTSTNRQIRRIRWTYDSKSLLYTDSETHLWLVPANGGAPVLVASGAGRDGPEFDVSPDSRWLALSYEDFTTYLSSVYLYEIATGRTTKLSNGLYDDFTPAFTKDGRYLAYLSRRTLDPQWDHLTSALTFRNTVRPYLLTLRKDLASPFAPTDDEVTPAKDAPFRIDLDGLDDRIVEVPAPAADMAGLEASKDRLFWVEGGTVSGYDLTAKRYARLGVGGEFRLSPDGSAILFDQGNRAQIVPAEVREVPRGEGVVDYGALQLRIDPVAEWRQIFWEGWRYARDYFYVPNMHGLDWRRVGEKYATLLPRVGSRNEVDRLFRGMLGELNVSHANITGGPTGSLKRRVAPAFLGVDLEPGSGGFMRIRRILMGDGNPSERSPLAEPGLNVKEGDYLLEVAGTPVRADSAYEEALVGRAGQVVSVVVNDRPSKEGARRLLVKPIGSEFRLRYLDWVRGRREETARLSGGKVGYIHLLSMMPPNYADFLRQYLPQRNRQALVVDLRFNTGGLISNLVMDYLRQPLVAYFNLRANSVPTSRQVQAFPGPKVVLINEFSKSNGEEFPHQFRTEGLGKLVGRRTWGGEVGSDPGWPFVDGGKIWIPNYGAWTPKDGWIIEGTGIEPDIDVPSDPNLFIQGKDPQLERGVREVLMELSKRPPTPVVTPREPIKAGEAKP